MYIKLYFSLENAIVRFYIQLSDIDIELAKDNLNDFVLESNAVYTLNIDIYQERKCFMGIPCRSNDTVAIAAL